MLSKSKKSLLIMLVVGVLMLMIAIPSFASVEVGDNEATQEQTIDEISILSDDEGIAPCFVSIFSHMAFITKTGSNTYEGTGQFSFQGNYTAYSTLVLQKKVSGSWTEVDRAFKPYYSSGAYSHTETLDGTGSGSYRVKSYVEIRSGNTVIEHSTEYDTL